MRSRFFFCVSILVANAAGGPVYAQSAVKPTYSGLITKAGAFYDSKEYQRSGEAYAQAFAGNGYKGFVSDRYNAACAWSLAGNKDSAFSQLNRIANVGYSGYNHMTIDADLDNLHSDKRWSKITARIKHNKEQEELGLDKQLVAELDTVMQTDQQYRMRIDGIASRYGNNSKAMRELWATINTYDSINLVKVTRILDKYGWPGPDVTGDEGSQALFLVIQHADVSRQEKYLPLMRQAVKDKKAAPSSLAMLEDRVALRQGKKQVYGSQVSGDGNEMWVSPLEDPDNVDKRRAEVGLAPLADYVRSWNIKWDVAEYKKKLPEIEAKEKMRQQQQ